jgi:phosphoribosylanthranilate isomerase
MTRVKICGLTRRRDVRLAVELGAWACGIVLTEGPRRVTPEDAVRLVDAAGATLTVGVFTVEPAEEVAAAVRTAGVGAVQLSGGADGPTVAEVRAALRGHGRQPLIIATADTPDVADGDLVLLDPRLPGLYGGTGHTLDWMALADEGELESETLVLAGGLTPVNVGEAIAALRPRVVDVASGVESAPGKKDPALLEAFFRAVTVADLPEASL